MFLLRRFPGTLAALLLLLVALAPSAASAHAGHKHSAAIESRADLSKSETGQRATQEAYSAGLVAPHAQHDHDCGDRGCCGNSHCAGCVTALAPSGFAEFSTPAKSLRVTLDAAVPPGLGTSGPPRPPRSFV